MLNTQWLLHFRSLASPSSPVMLLSVVLTDRPSKCSQSKGAGLVKLGPDWEGRGDAGTLEEGPFGLTGVSG